MHWAKRNNYNKTWHYDILVAKSKAKIHGRPQYTGVTIHIDQRYYRRKPMDPDNLIASTKCMVDALVTNGIIKDDDPECVKHVSCSQTLVPRDDVVTRITIQLADKP